MAGNQHFAYLYTGPSQNQVSPDRLELLAKVAARRFIEGRTPLNETITKFASENDLNTNQIERVCEMSNVAVHQALWPSASEKEKVAFPLADAKAVITITKAAPGGGGGSGCCCPDAAPRSVNADYAGPPAGIPRSGPSMLSLMGSDPSAVHNGLSSVPPKRELVVVIEKKAAERRRAHDALVVKQLEYEASVETAYRTVKQAALSGVPFPKIAEAAFSGGLGKIAGELLPGFQKRLIGETAGSVRTMLEKTAIQKAPEEYISQELGNVSVSNGAHPVLISLDTVQRKTGEVENGLRNLIRLDDEIKIFTQRLRELT
jgi:hypothetical protein